MPQHILSDMTIARPAGALSESLVRDKWIVIPYEGEISGKMIWAPARSCPPEVTIPLPAAGRCRICIGIYSSGTYPLWLNTYRPPKGSTAAPTNTIIRVLARLSGEDWFENLVPVHFPGQPRFTHICELYWKTADVTGKSLVLATPRRDVFTDTNAFVAYVRLVPDDRVETWPRETKRLATYFDSDFAGHFVRSARDIKSCLMPLRDSDFDTVFWTTCHEDTCSYPTRVGNVNDYDGPEGVYPFFEGRDMRELLAHGEDPLKIACDAAHECGLEFFASYRRLTRRMPPFVFPMHPNALLARRPDLWCADERGGPVPHLSMTYPEVRNRTISILAEQAENYDIDGVHFFFCRGVPFVFFEKPFLEAFRREHGADPRGLPLDDTRVWKTRAGFFLQFLRELRTALDRAGQKRGNRVKVAMTVMNSLRSCAFYGMDIEAIARERLVDMLLPAHAHFIPRELGEWRTTPECVAEFVAAARGSGIQVRPECFGQYWEDKLPDAERAARYYALGVDGLDVSPRKETFRLGHVAELKQLAAAPDESARLVHVETVAGLRLDIHYGIPTVG